MKTNLQASVLVLNRSWQAIDITTVEVALCDMYRGACTGIDTDTMKPVRWDEWAKLAVDGKDSLMTMHGAVRVPTVVCKAQYATMPKKRPKLNRRGVGERDGFKCAYTGVHCPDGTLDHVLPRSRGGKDAWENLVWSAKEVNHRKANKTPAEAGLRLLHQPRKPKPQPVCATIRPIHPDWALFLST